MKKVYIIKGKRHKKNGSVQIINKSVNVLIIGGSGLWCERNHIPAILKMKEQGSSVKVLAICDPQNPYRTDLPNLKAVLDNDNPRWINTIGISKRHLFAELTQLHNKTLIDFVIIACDPVYHLNYIDWATRLRVPIICDKPPIVFENAASDLSNAIKISAYYDEISFRVSIDSLLTPGYNFYIPLRRRALKPNIEVYENLKEIYDKTGQGIVFFKMDVYGGIHRFPEEFLKSGAHGYTNGVGSLSHSAYHYVDLIAWYLSAAPGNIARLEINISYIQRVSDYVATKSYATLGRQLNQNHIDDVNIGKNILNAELNFGFTINMLDENNNHIGVTQFNFNHTSYTTRTAPIDSLTNDPANKHNGGRMSNYDIVIHQGTMQSIELRKNDPVHSEYKIHKSRRTHSTLNIPDESKDYYDAHKNETLTPQDLVHEILKRNKSAHGTINVSTIESQKFTNKLFGSFYELIAEDLAIKKERSSKQAIKIIDLKRFL